MQPRHAPHPFWILSLIAALALALAGCGGSAPAADTTVNPVVDPVPPADPPPTAGPEAIDVQLLALLDRANVVTPPAPPAQPQALVDLGRALFFDKVLSGNRNISCATCHHPAGASGDALSVSIGEGGTGTAAARQLASGHLVARNAPPLFNRGLPNVRNMFWDSRVSRAGPGAGILNTPEPALNGPNPAAAEIAAQLTTALAAQAIFPPTSAAEMRGEPGENDLADAPDNLTVWRRIMARLVGTRNGTEGGIAAYRSLFQQAYPQVVDFDALNIGHAARAIAAYEDQTYRALDAPLDDYVAGDLGALSDQAKRGGVIFYTRGTCVRCHGGPLLTDARHHVLAVPQVGPGADFPFEDTGRGAVTGDPDDDYAFRTPSLRNVALTGPWMHDGAYTTLTATVAHYRNPAGAAQNYDVNQLVPLLRATFDVDPTRNQARADALSGILRPAPRLSPGDVQDLVAFLGALTDPASVDLSSEVPASVPSGLPVGD